MPQAYDAHGRHAGPNVGAQGGSVSLRDGLIWMYAQSDGGADENDGGKDQGRETGDASLLSGLLLAESGRAARNPGGGQSGFINSQGDQPRICPTGPLVRGAACWYMLGR